MGKGTALSNARLKAGFLIQFVNSVIYLRLNCILKLIFKFNHLLWNLVMS